MEGCMGDWEDEIAIAVALAINALKNAGVKHRKGLHVVAWNHCVNYKQSPGWKQFSGWSAHSRQESVMSRRGL